MEVQTYVPQLPVLHSSCRRCISRWVSGAKANRAKSMASALACALSIFPIASMGSATSNDLHADVERSLRDNGLTGAAWSLVTPEGIIAVDAAGVRDARSGEQLRLDDRIHIGSVTKTLLAAGVLRLVSEGRLALDSPIAQLLPQLAFDNPWQASDPIRLRHVLDHTAGLDDARLWQIFSLEPQVDTPLAEAFTRDPRVLRIRSRPGSRFSYSNMGYALLGMVIESITGERYERYLDSRLLQPLGMHDSSFAFVSQAGPTADARLAMGHFEAGEAQSTVPAYLRPATQFTTTAKDMALFSQFLMGDGRIDGNAFIETGLLRAMGQPFGTEAVHAGLAAGYGLGLARRDRHGVVGRCHSGNTVGYRAMLCLFPQQQKAFFVAINSDSETADYGRFDALFVKALGIAADLPPVPRKPSDAMAPWEGVYTPAPNRFATLAWLDMVFNFVHVGWDGSQLQLSSLQSGRRSLQPVGGLLFRASDRATTSHVLLMANDGGRVLSDGFQSYERVSMARVIPMWMSLCAGVLGLLYIFFAGAVRLLRGRLKPSQAMFVPLVSVIALIFPLPLYSQQSFLQLGDVTAASVAVAIVTALLPLGMLVGLVVQWRSRAKIGADAVAMIAVLQWMIVLAACGLVPLRLWQ